MVKHYYLFFGMNYYPSGGLDDLMGKFDSVEAAKAAFSFAYDWGYIVTIDENGDFVDVAHVGYSLEDHRTRWIDD